MLLDQSLEMITARAAALPLPARPVIGGRLADAVDGGLRQSGFRRDHSLHALHKYADLKSLSITLR